MNKLKQKLNINKKCDKKLSKDILKKYKSRKNEARNERLYKYRKCKKCFFCSRL